MKTYRVGGSVRDELLGRPVADRDYVVVGATPEELLAPGFAQSAATFPCSCTPKRTRNTLALPGARPDAGIRASFSTAPGVTLEEDLARRDLTINAMARRRWNVDRPLWRRKDCTRAYCATSAGVCRGSAARIARRALRCPLWLRGRAETEAMMRAIVARRARADGGTRLAGACPSADGSDSIAFLPYCAAAGAGAALP